MNKKKLRNILLPIVIIAVIVACYVGYFMRTQPLLDCMTGTDIPPPEKSPGTMRPTRTAPRPGVRPVAGHPGH